MRELVGAALTSDRSLVSEFCQAWLLMEIAALRNQITSVLEFRSLNITPDGLPNFTEYVESYLLLKVRTELMSILRSRIPGARTSHDDTSVQIEGAIYILDITESNAGTRSMIRILFRSTAPPRRDWPQTRIRVQIEGHGHFSKLSISVPETISSHIEALGQATQCIYEAGYRWLLEFSKQKLGTLVDSLSIELYGYLRTIFSSLQNPAIAELVYLGIVDTSGATYILDQVTAERVVTIFEEREKQHQLSPVVLSAELLTSSVDFDKSFNKEAIERGDCVEVDLSNAKYFEEQPIYDVAERALLGTTGVCFFPLAASGQQYLSSWFPTSVREDVLPILNKHKAEFGKIFSKHRSRVRRIWKSSLAKTGGSILTRAAAQFSAEFIKELFQIR